MTEPVETTKPGYPPCPVCGFADWPEGGMVAARSIHIRDHERRGESSLVDYLRDKLEAAAEPACSCPNCDVSTWDDPGATRKGWSRHCPIHGLAGSKPPGAVGYGYAGRFSTLVYLNHAGWYCRECDAEGPESELTVPFEHARSHEPPRRKRWWRR